MNQEHLRICSSPEWASYVETVLLPWALGTGDLGDDVVEIGPGPGLTTDVLRRSVARLTAVEIDADLAAALAERMVGTNVEVLHADGTDLPCDSGSFSAAALFTMLHHVPSVARQDELFEELHRVLRPDGVLLGTDSVETASRRVAAPGRQLHPGRSVDPNGSSHRRRIYRCGRRGG